MTAHQEAVRKLGIELIDSALKDLKNRRDGNGNREKALAWFNERSLNPCGYGWALQVSGGNPNVIRRSIIKIIGEARGKLPVS